MRSIPAHSAETGAGPRATSPNTAGDYRNYKEKEQKGKTKTAVTAGRTRSHHQQTPTRNILMHVGGSCFTIGQIPGPLAWRPVFVLAVVSFVLFCSTAANGQASRRLRRRRSARRGNSGDARAISPGHLPTYFPAAPGARRAMCPLKRDAREETHHQRIALAIGCSETGLELRPFVV